MQNAAIYFYVLLLARGGGVGGLIHGIGIGYPNCIHIIKINTQLIPNYIRKISFVIHYVCILPLNSQTLLGFGPRLLNR